MIDSDGPSHFGDWIKSRRKALDLTQGELAERADCSVFALRKIESGERRPSKQLAMLLAAALDIPPDEQPAFVRVARGELRSDRLRALSFESAAAPSVEHPKTVRTCPRLASCRLPFPPTPLLGRDSELAALERLFDDDQCRLLTLTGLGGMGKTRLAVEFARRQCAMFPGGVVYTPLASLNSAELIVPAVAEAVEFAFSGPTEEKEQLFNFLAASTHERLLLVLDNVEHLLHPITTSDGGTDAAALVSEILERLPQVKILATSRERLNLRGEWTYELHGLPLPAVEFPERLEQYSSAALFLQSARRVRTNFAATGDVEEQLAIIKICQLLEGIPLAIELATAWVETLSCAEIAREIELNIDFLNASMRDIPERHRSMRATFDHSWKLLSDSEREALSRLSVFQGGFGREAAEQIAAATLPLLASLVSKSLVRRTENGRYDLHEVIRQYAGAYLAQTPSQSVETRDGHCYYFLNLVADREQALKSGQQQEAITELTREMDNIRTAWAWAVEHRYASLLGAAVRSLGWMFEVSGLLREGIEHLELLVRVSQAAPREEWARAQGLAYAQLGLLYFRTGRFARAQQLYQDAIAVLRSVGDPALLADALIFLAVIKHLNGEFSESRALLDEGLVCARAGRDRWFEAYAIFNLGYVDSLTGDFENGYARMQTAISIWRALGDPHSIALGLNHLVSTMIRLKLFEEARNYMRESIGLCEQTGNRWGMGTAWRYLGLVVMAEGNFVEAQSHFRKSLEVFGEYFEGWDIARSLTYLAEATILLGNVDEARTIFLEALRVAKQVDSVPLMLDAIAGLAQVEASLGHTARALELASWVLERESLEHQIRVYTERFKSDIADSVEPSQLQAVRERISDQSLEAITNMLLA